MTCAQEPPPRSRGVIVLTEPNCTVCMICARECPDWCITIEGHQETVDRGGGRPLVRNVLDEFVIDYGLCMYCGICIEACPFDALSWEPSFAYPAPTRSGLRHGRARLGGWSGTAPSGVPEPDQT